MAVWSSRSEIVADRVKADYQAEVDRYRIVFETYLAMADQPVREAGRMYEHGLEELWGLRTSVGRSAT